MHLNTTAQGLLIYIVMGLHLLALLFHLLQRRRVARAIYAIGFSMACVTWVYRWFHVGHLPLQNLYEVFLFLGMVMIPISMLGRYALRISAEPADMVLALIVLFPAGFIFDAVPRHLPPALQSWLFGPHVAAYMLAYIVMAKAAVQAFLQLIGHTPSADSGLIDHERGTYRLVCLGFPLLTLGLILGSLWGKLAWGDYWNWDPKELWSLATWVVYLVYFHVRAMFGRRYGRINSLLALLGLFCIIITLLWVNLSRLFSGLHSYT
ncbi:MAG: cytochrome c biogenesis protein CcsA [Sedimentisphaerales bacterium]|nr:cytochrome c biogenesis protein CcsA [Sedimentisphaerales bacterium]